MTRQDPSSGLPSRVSRSVVTGLPRAQTFKRQQSELRRELEPVLEPVQPTRTVSMDRSLLRWPPTPEEMPHDRHESGYLGNRGKRGTCKRQLWLGGSCAVRRGLGCRCAESFWNARVRHADRNIAAAKSTRAGRNVPTTGTSVLRELGSSKCPTCAAVFNLDIWDWNGDGNLAFFLLLLRWEMTGAWSGREMVGA
ncbi:hypothetical protein MHUMG1_00014 [Metarhizium humberi]|uniref:Uncharacterized protein n=1 Tax=Metarhizium humberi TaxID=2596975 RepID=A0A9P8SBH3_9HYPO|nr:hypothetical protein MHUMG1_00014 [Metarhizium humberi]